MDTLATLLVALKREKEAHTWFQSAANYAPNNPNIQFRFAKSAALAGDRERALEVVNDILAKFSKFQERKNAEKLRTTLAQ